MWSVGPNLAETLFDAGLRKATVQQFQASYDQTVANYRQTVLTAFQQVEDNLAAMRILSETVEQQDAAVRSAERGLREATVRYSAGLDPWLNVLNAQTLLLASRQTAVNYCSQRMIASVQLIKALAAAGTDRARFAENTAAPLKNRVGVVSPGASRSQTTPGGSPAAGQKPGPTIVCGGFWVWLRVNPAQPDRRRHAIERQHIRRRPVIHLVLLAIRRTASKLRTIISSSRVFTRSSFQKKPCRSCTHSK